MTGDAVQKFFAICLQLCYSQFKNQAYDEFARTGNPYLQKLYLSFSEGKAPGLPGCLFLLGTSKQGRRGGQRFRCCRRGRPPDDPAVRGRDLPKRWAKREMFPRAGDRGSPLRPLPAPAKCADLQERKNFAHLLEVVGQLCYNGEGIMVNMQFYCHFSPGRSAAPVENDI